MEEERCSEGDINRLSTLAIGYTLKTDVEHNIISHTSVCLVNTFCVALNTISVLSHLACCVYKFST